MAELVGRNFNSRDHFTSRELEILLLVATGASAKEIARKLKIASRTVEAHINHLKLKTRSRNRAHLVAVALDEGLIANPCHPEPPPEITLFSHME